MPLVVGVDAGGSRTVAAAADGDASPRTVVGDPAGLSARGVEPAADAIARAVGRVLGDDRPAAIAVGAAGAGRLDVANALAAALRARFPGAPVAVTDDARIALRGALPAGDGIVLIAGTGAIAYGEFGERRCRAGGGGYALGDDGSGYAIGGAALKLLLRSFEGRSPRDPLLDAVAARTGVAGIDDLLTFAYANGTPVPTVASVAPIVLEFAGAGVRSALKIVQQAALELFDLVRTVWHASGETSELPLAFSGGLLAANTQLSYLVEVRIGSELPQLRIVKNGGPPYLGALAEARALLHS